MFGAFSDDRGTNNSDDESIQDDGVDVIEQVNNNEKQNQDIEKKHI